jgi:predicted nucleic acid-binding protein
MRHLEDPLHEWVSVSSALEREAVTRWLACFSDQEFSLTDAVSFEVMQRTKLTHAFAVDGHFAIAGFELLT